MSSREAVLGVDLGGTRVRAGKVRCGQVESNMSQRISGKESMEVVLGEIFSTIDEVFDREVAGIGVGVPSVVDVERGIVYSVENIKSWREVPLKEELERRYKVPACINNDANAFVVGELHYGKGRGFRHLVGLAVGTGLGAGVVIDGHLYSGANCGAGELGSIPYRDATLEHYCSGAFLQRESGIAGELLYERARDGDAEARELIETLGTSFGDAILIVMYAYDPEIIILGGSVSRAYPMFESRMRRRLASYPYPHALDKLVIERSEIEDVALLGAAAIYLDAMLTKTI